MFMCVGFFFSSRSFRSRPTDLPPAVRLTPILFFRTFRIFFNRTIFSAKARHRMVERSSNHIYNRVKL